ncbi:Transcription factor bye1 [Emydomyces testavorans]|uniref:Transcription factor BYE1 n=1 Tax=Emydomyces testavorans TaxID=2070801 RepID=A0AAF0DHB7_9EURO|nr:Transcription factor bye1 [Emydomyces testavorans]
MSINHFTEEPRRSGRATKGQHKNLDMPEPPPKKRRGKAQTKAQKQTSNEPTPPANEEEEIIRCVCGEYEEEEDVERDMICCDKCSAWQHNDCMGLIFGKGEEPAEYFCEQCKPENHTGLLERMARGEKPWEEAAKIRAQAAEERKTKRKKGGKRGRKSRVSDIKSEMSDVTTSAAATPIRETIQPSNEGQNGPAAHTEKQEPPSAQKRKYSDQEDTAQHEPGPKMKFQRLSVSGLPADSQETKTHTARSRTISLAGSPTTHDSKTRMSSADAAGGGVDHLSQARRNVANALIKLFIEQAGVAQEHGKFSIPEGQTRDSVGRALGVAIEQAMYHNLCGGSGEPNESYRQQMRTMLFNVRKNPSLRDNLLVGRISPDAFSKMSTQDMASEELRQRDDEIKREAERQHIIIQETGPRIRRTHKGEEFVEPDSQFVGTESVFSTAPARRDTTGEAISPGAASPTTAPAGSMDADQQEPKPHHIDTRIGSTEGLTGQSASPDFNIQNVWSSVQSPGAVAHHSLPQFGPPTFSHEHPPPSAHRVQADAEIDQLLKDEEPESPPYSPKDFPGPGTVWRGKVFMDGVASLSAEARYVGGADLSGRIPWSQMIPPLLAIDGRIDTQLATNYLCGHRYSNTTDVSVIAIPLPDTPDDVVNFNNLFNHLVRRQRYGVIGKHPLAAVKDTYLVPVEAGPGTIPEFMELLENNTVEDPTPERLILVVFVVKTSNNHSNNVTPSAITASPLIATPNASHTPLRLPFAPGQSNGPSRSPSQSQGQYSPAVPQQPYNQPQSPSLGLNGKAAAIHVLGEQLASSPTIEEVLKHAPNADVAQFNVIAEILAQNPSAASSYEHLMNALMERTNGGM